MSNSPLVQYTRISPNSNNPRNHKIDKITIHHTAGVISVESLGEIFAPSSRQASSNYGIGSDGRIAMYVEECNGSWCSSNKSNDMRAVTIEVANDGGESTGWHVSEKAMNALTEIMLNGSKYNLTEKNIDTIEDKNFEVVKHFIDSLICLDYPELKDAKKIIDVGTGAGFPGVPLAVTAPEKDFVLMDSLNKRLKIIDELCSEAGIHNVTTIHARAEELARSKAHREKYDLCISRAVANMSVLAEYCLPFVKPGGYFLAYKGPEAAAEAEQAAGHIDEARGYYNNILQIRPNFMDVAAKIEALG